MYNCIGTRNRHRAPGTRKMVRVGRRIGSFRASVRALVMAHMGQSLAAENLRVNFIDLAHFIRFVSKEGDALGPHIPRASARCFVPYHSGEAADRDAV